MQKQKIEAERKARDEEAKQKADLKRKKDEQAALDEAYVKRHCDASNSVEVRGYEIPNYILPSNPKTTDQSRFGTSYKVTAQSQDKSGEYPPAMDNYNIDDLSSGDETDDDQKPRKAVPAWAQKSVLHSALKRQYKSKR